MTPTKIVIISGKQGSGKSTLAQELVAWANKHLWVSKIIKFADPLYEMHNAVKSVAESHGIAMTDKDGLLLQLLGTDWGRKKFGDDVWVKLCRKAVNDQIDFWRRLKSTKSVQLIVIDDCRFPPELTEFSDAIKIRLECPRIIRKLRAHAWRDNDTHESEMGLDGMETQFDLVLNSMYLSPQALVSRIEEKLTGSYSPKS